MSTPRCVSILSIHLLLSVACLAVGFFCPFYFGFYDQCDFVVPEHTTAGWSIHRDLTDLYLATVLLGFVFLGISIGIIDIRHAYGYDKHSVLLLSLFGSFGVYLLLKILLLDEIVNTGWASQCRQTRIEFWLIFGTMLGSISIAMVVPFCKTSEKSNTDINRDVNATREELERLLEEEEARKLGDGRAMSRLLAESVPDLHWVCLAFVALLVAAGADLFNPWYVGEIINHVLITRDRDAFLNNIMIISIVSLVSAIATGLRGGIFTMVMARMGLRIRTRLFSRIMHQEISFFDETKTGDITSRLSSDCKTMVDTLSLNINVFLRCSVKTIGCLVFMLKLSWNLTLVTIIGLPFGFLLGKVWGMLFRKLQKDIQDALAKANALADETISSARTVRSFANEEGEAKNYYEKMKVAYLLQMKSALYYGNYACFNLIFELGLTCATLWYGGHLVLVDRMEGAALVPFLLYQLSLGDSLQGMGAVYTGLMQAVGAAEKVFEFIDRQSRMPLDVGTHDPAEVQGKIEFKDVSFYYPSRPDQPILSNLSLEFPAGKVTALVGSSGGGKSSIVSLLCRLYDRISGDILIDGVDIKHFKHHALHRTVTIVQQEPVLFARSIRDNILYGPLELEDEETAIDSAIGKAAAKDFIQGMTKGLETETGERGHQLSGGQKQRIAIARSLVRKPKILILDEATSALDAESEFLVQNALDKIQRTENLTILLIAHRLSTVQNADQIIVIDKGQVAEKGTHTELMSKQSFYFNLVSRQISTQEQQAEMLTNHGQSDYDNI